MVFNKKRDNSWIVKCSNSNVLDNTPKSASSILMIFITWNEFIPNSPKGAKELKSGVREPDASDITFLR